MRRNHLILQVEDDPNDAFFLKFAFKEAGITNPLVVVVDGQEAIDYLSGAGEFGDRSQHPLPCLMILDLKLPRYSGTDVLRWLRQQPELKCLPVIIHSGSAQESDVDELYRLGANAYVVKPVSMEQRIEFARHLKGFWLEFNEPPSICTSGG